MVGGAQQDLRNALKGEEDRQDGEGDQQKGQRQQYRVHVEHEE